MKRPAVSMDPIRQVYAGLVRKFGDDPRSLFWKGRPEQLLRMEVLADIAPNWNSQSVLDVGCGFCDMHDVLAGRGFRGRYTGVDITEDVLKIARVRHPGLYMLNRDILAEPLEETFDYVFASGTFNLRFCDAMPAFIDAMLKTMFDRAKSGVAVNFLSTYVDFRHPQAWHTDPAWIFGRAKRLTRRVLLRHDYMPYEFTLYLYPDDSSSPSHVFSEYARGNPVKDGDEKRR